MPIVAVTSPEDPRLEPYLSVRERDLVGRDGRFIVEGKVTLGVLLERGRFPLESVLIAEHRHVGLADLLDRVPGSVPIYAAPQAVMDSVAGFPMHRGVLAVALKAGARPASALLETCGPRSAVLVLAGLSNHDNVGAAFRNAAAFGVDAVLLDGECCDPLYRKAIRVSAGTALWLPFAHGGSALDLVETLKRTGYAVWALTPREEATAIGDMSRPDKLALVLGAEGPGLADDLIDAASPVRIPMAPGVDSLNVATAGAIALSQVFAQS